ncbi:hypothetical protein L1987_04448 [Smallanthus sonchifolius]|uniref:Uncharacterized protein n=1 Tax=Smallanthus sonchifolius TaxID=185202 RepID=A0ACB9KDG3_9ASTR|nr:hypothetical protein L1987_04448 [Smallanthus sonchifolius]
MAESAPLDLEFQTLHNDYKEEFDKTETAYQVVDGIESRMSNESEKLMEGEMGEEPLDSGEGRADRWEKRRWDLGLQISEEKGRLSKKGLPPSLGASDLNTISLSFIHKLNQNVFTPTKPI